MRDELARRCASNAQYSLRSLALDVNVDASSLSQILRGKRALTATTIERIGRRIGLDEDEIRAFVAAEEFVRATADLTGVEQLAHDVAALVADGCHYAILELVRLDSFQPDSRWIARVLGNDVDEVNVAIQRLLRLGLLEMVASDRWVARSSGSRASVAGFTHAAFERLAREVRALDADPAQRAPRDHSSTTLAVDSRRLPDALALLARARRDLVKLLESSDARDDVYRLEIHFFPLTRLSAAGDPDDGPTRDALSDPRQTS